ncbi:MAG: hypothetical protein J7539_17965, partial [Niabella sp.]|nr:hypothetical protein [Niabella sp.]
LLFIEKKNTGARIFLVIILLILDLCLTYVGFGKPNFSESIIFCRLIADLTLVIYSLLVVKIRNV